MEYRTKWYEVLVGTCFMFVAVAMAWHVIQNPDHDNTLARFVIGSIGVMGLFIAFPARASAMWKIVRDYLPRYHRRDYEKKDEK